MRRAAVRAGRSTARPARPTVDPVKRVADHAVQMSEMIGQPITRERVTTLIHEMSRLNLLRHKPQSARVWHYLCLVRPDLVRRSSDDQEPDDGAPLPGEVPKVTPTDLDAL
jgi:hypothetical protein